VTFFHDLKMNISQPKVSLVLRLHSIRHVNRYNSPPEVTERDRDDSKLGVSSLHG
jgi:hypothetical protein